MLGLLILLGIALALLVALLATMMAWQMVHPPRHTAGWALARGVPCDPNDLNLKFDEWWLDRPENLRLPVWEVRSGQRSVINDQPGTSAGLGLTAVFVHGWGHSRVDSLQRIGPFLPLVERIVLYDLRGHGEAMGSASTLGDGEDDDLIALIEHLGEGPLLLVGHSMGAVIALRAAATLNSQLSAVSDQRSSRGHIAGVIAYAPYCDFHRSLQGRLWVNSLPARPLTDLALLAHRLRGMKPAALDPDELRGLGVPILIVHGGQDLVSPMDDARQLAEALPHATLLEIDDAAHADAHSVDQARHDEAVRMCIERIRDRASGLVA